MGDKSITTEVVVILFFSCGLRFIHKFMHAAEAFCAWIYTLAPCRADEDSHPQYSFGGQLMKENLEGFYHFNYKPAQWEPKPSFKLRGSVDEGKFGRFLSLQLQTCSMGTEAQL